MQRERNETNITLIIVPKLHQLKCVASFKVNLFYVTFGKINNILFTNLGEIVF